MRLIVTKTTLIILRHLYYQQGRGIFFAKIILRRGLLEGTHKLGQPMTKVYITYAPPPKAPSCCTVRQRKEIYIHLRLTVSRPVATAADHPIGKISSSKYFLVFLKCRRSETELIAPGSTCKY